MIGQAFLSSIGGLLIDSVNINNILLRFHELACRTAVIFLRFQALALGLPPFACKRKEKKNTSSSAGYVITEHIPFYRRSV